MPAPVWVAAATVLLALLLVTAGRRWRTRRRAPRALTREEKLAAARVAARGLRRDARRAGPGLATTDSAEPRSNWDSFSGGPPTDAG
ncbi:hypothetical protein [Micromonospora auratinigra]|uniref:Uncharacterized protein n=1 Tax=Micromonospora auratinigra TaxID=261654 RepID=A0A1A8ZIM1_9ACTN|nr:hypothetical protein [Micromonospora auratinigra]SBT43687.1 hypothetical protein GA0070611_2420 [Micromonospora auratinigra]